MEGVKGFVRLLVDGYNIIGAWPLLRQTQRHEGFDAARRELTEILANYSARKGFDTHLVFDAHLVQSPGTEEVITQNLAIHYTAFGQTADTYIEKVCARFLHHPIKSNRLIVATSDRVHQQTVTGYGAEWMSAKQLESDVRITAHHTRHRKTPRPQPSSRSLMQGLDDQAREKLTKLRFGIR